MNTLSVSLQKIVDDYKNDLQKFIAENYLDAELARDIEERIFEKIATLENPTRKDILKILAEIGTPEEIFAEEINLQNDEKPKNFFEKFHERTNKIIFLGTFFELAKKTSISANIFRILFFAMIIFGFTVWDGFLFIFPIFAYFIWFLLFRTRFFGFLFSLGLGAFFTILLVPSVILFGMYLSDFHIENMYPFMGISVLFPIGMVLGIFSLVLFILYFFRYAFTKKWFGVGFLVTAIVSFVVAISMGIATVVDVAGKFRVLNFGAKEIAIEVPENIVFNPYTLSSGYRGKEYVENIFGFELWETYGYYPDIEMSPDDKIHLSITKEYGGFENGANVFDIEKIQFENEYPRIFIKNSGERFTIGRTVFRAEKVKIPANVIFTTHPNTGFIYNNRHNIAIPNVEKYSAIEIAIIQEDCGKYKFDESGKIYCVATEDEIVNILKYGKERRKWIPESEINYVIQD